MNVKSTVENKEKFSVELVIEVGKEQFEAAIDRVYKKNRGTISIPGFRKGKAPRKVIEGMYGSAVFYQDAVEEVYPVAVEEAIKEQNLDIAAAPKVEIMEISEEGFTFKADIIVRPEVAIEGYKGLEENKVLATVTDEAVQNELNGFIERASYMEAVERPAANGDTACIDFKGMKDGVPFQGGTGENFDLVLGSNSFIPGFEDQVVGMSAGEEKEISVTFPEDYQAEDLAGKPAVFEVKLHEVKTKVLPALDDEFAKDVSEFDTLDSFKDDLRAKIADRNMAMSEERFKAALLEQLAAKVEIDLPEALVEAQIDRLMSDYSARLEQQGISMDMYMSYMQMTMDAMRNELRPNAEKQIRTQLALEAIARAEDIQITDEEVNEEFKKISESMNLPIADIESVLEKDKFKIDMARDRALNIVTSNAKANIISEEEAMKIEEVKAEEPKEETEKPAKKTTTKKTTTKKTTTKSASGETTAKKTTKKATSETAAKKTTKKDTTDAAGEKKEPATKRKTTKKAEEKTEE